MHPSNSDESAPLLPALNENAATGTGSATVSIPIAHRSLASRVFRNEQGFRAGWLIFAFLAIAGIFLIAISSAAILILQKLLHPKTGHLTAVSAIVQEAIPVLSILAAAWIMGRIEGRRVRDYNLSGPAMPAHFATGVVAGFGMLSLLIGCLKFGGWIKFGALALTGFQIVEMAALWAVAFLLTALFEEGAFRGYIQFTLARGVNFLWALGTVCAICFATLLNQHSNGSWGVYAFGLVGLMPCLLLHLRQIPGQRFWQAAWVTSTLFGYLHTFNEGETWFGIFCTAAIGFVLCASIRLTGSLWWAIGFHATWDWGQTYFYGTPDSGFSAAGHLLTTTPTGNILWSGGADGPEGSLLVFPIIVLTMLLLLAIYGRKRAPDTESLSATRQAQLS